MPKILELDRHVADLIAAGEVVERPASAAKELMENAVDAGATQVTVEIQNGGMTYLRVTDNGCGIAPEDVETAFLRHATSKLRTKEDLAAIGTLGFRGEALAAIASVSKIDLLTKTAEAEGVSLRLEAGKVVERSPAGCPEGTTIVVRELFYNTPARLKFMKRDTVEASQVAGAVQRQALAHPDVAFRFLKDGEMVLKTAGNGDLYGAVYQVFGRQLAVDMIPVESSFEGLKLSGFVTKPTATRGNRSMQQFFVNGRPVRAKLLTAALEEAYANQMMSGRYPSCVLVITLPNAAVDVNVHPAKTEVKFANERAVFDLVRYGVMSALGRAQQRPEMKLAKPMAEKPKPSEVRSALEALHTSAPVSPQVRSALSQPQFRQPVASPAPSRGSVPVYLPKRQPPVQRAPMEEKRPTPPPVQEKQPVQEKLPEPQEEAQTALDMPAAAPYRVVGEVLDTYFILEQGDAVLFLDKHAAHERILFEKLRASQEPVLSQVLLSPHAANLSREEAATVLEHRELLRDYGYEVDDFGDGTVLLRQIPADLPEDEAEAVLEAMAQELAEGHARDPKSLRDELLHTIACKAAIKGGWHTDPKERDALIREVMTRDDIRYCPHGRPVVLRLTKGQIEKQFKR
ncbi:MAG TPA: DNA mismatch repair endonuclease MutL [Candidatus Avoscillospira stercoripullorum]|uniref:DNA mismatch repair protein MutL n=1 Tax=Candidatus Avoscillospira stercoripullorum TaxID=2840709 RepID=A0A9D1A7U6_9FIRM|nr:DNA mismatch repair endonuclease MutL [Candidatus Avoscillospira stercoripullorum]